MRVLDLFAGLGGWSTAFAERGHEVITVDIESRFGCTYTADVLEWKPEGDFDIVLASPPCESFSILTIPRRWLSGYRPKGPEAEMAMALVRRTVELIELIDPAFWVVENPRAMLRKLHLLPYERRTVTYCRLGEPFRKPTDLWGGFPPSLDLPAPCRARGELVEVDGITWVTDDDGERCHVSAPRGSRTGIQGDGARNTEWLRARAVASAALFGTWDKPTTAALRAKIPDRLALSVCVAAERDLAAGRRAADYTGRLFA